MLSYIIKYLSYSLISWIVITCSSLLLNAMETKNRPVLIVHNKDGDIAEVTIHNAGKIK
jgi:hypothetical protein